MYPLQMQEAVSTRDMTHALKSDEEKRYAEEKIRFDKMLGVGGSPKKVAAVPARKGAKA